MSNEPITIFVQVYYPEIWDEMSQLVRERVRVPYRLVLTTCGSASHLRIPKSAHLIAVDVLEVENRGRDVRPFLKSLAEADDFEIGLKLHTKKSPQRIDGARWLAGLLDSLLPPAGASKVVDCLKETEHVGLVAPAGFCLPVEPWILQNETAMTSVALASERPLRAGDLSECYFPAGSMFWFRRRAVATLAVPSVLSLFEEEAGQLDGTIAHGVERLFAVEAKRNGFLTVAMPALMSASPDRTSHYLMGETRLHAEKPNALFPGPYIEAQPLAPSVRAVQRSDTFRNLLQPIVRALPRPVKNGLKHLIQR